ncbi:hypothetical protein DAPPUDRAFT_328708 [Daphnia pulex]|uniref:Uncharacterized protein n=1 Tax=Daphnia pulex TaxID=6669 RepID=E9HEI8_DAPPU|nr:hypothetical protein DAPPUDRAFT_328708 [Daphnia pulex]|eukprot:EFX69854.1 hypothetical protein DAPPUDRAFT_328708 [Daphnia pulex]
MEQNVENNGENLQIENVGSPHPDKSGRKCHCGWVRLKSILEPASCLFLDFGANTLSNSGYVLAAMIFTFMIIQIVLASILVRLNLENVINNGRFKFLSFLMTLVASISLILMATKTLMQEGHRYYLK